MGRTYEKKILDCKALDIDTSKRQVKIAFAKVDDLDRDEDIFDPSAFTKSIKENGPQGSNEIWHLLDHKGNSFSALSKFMEVGMDGQYLYGVSKYKDSFAWREVAWPLYESGDFTQHSIGFTTTKDAKNDDGYRVIKEARIYEGSAVLWGANPNTPVMELIKSEFDEELDEYEMMIARFERAIKRLKEDKFSDGNKSLLLIELLQLQNNFISQKLQKATKPDAVTAQKSTLPEANEVDEVLTNFITELNLQTWNKKNFLKNSTS
jgi:HK97 family phage prohead protease